jgi:transcriptional regulator with XRE-family HTH domain
LAALEAAFERQPWSLRGWAKEASIKPNTLLAVRAGTSWPDFTTLHAMADCLDLTLRVEGRQPLPAPQLKWVPLREVDRRSVRDRFEAAQAGSADDRCRMAHDLICWQLEYARRARGVTPEHLRTRAGISANTVTRLRLGPERGQFVSYQVLLSLAFDGGLAIRVVPRSTELKLAWSWKDPLSTPATASEPARRPVSPREQFERALREGTWR